MSSLRLRQTGFTLLELLIALVIIGLLVGVVGPNLFKNLGKSEITTAQQQIDALSKALEQYRLDTGHFPRTEQGLVALAQQPADEPRWRGPYLKKAVPPDPWGQPYLYRSPGSGGRDFDLSSNGPTGKPGGSGENAAITN
ncbi:type II secretion system major pseudopilin GspG [Chitinimonas sp. BJB300]|uniref:type II secretion system major pseudopilin GspG n=1 Tax=Chitinimonas sp. BJB300 TaxID=1559339 RepID=UPI000C0EAE8D|nr:type II secretion system major pseudopilin GspG [Chitinimonas sp. BJB300]PHV13524.1 type II secretion system protein GspG [Chitinimonas sp. BJB300]TSJ89793.1 type II secretion system protein GspG [Chitinimonas sp. BJB300]